MFAEESEDSSEIFVFNPSNFVSTTSSQSRWCHSPGWRFRRGIEGDFTGFRLDTRGGEYQTRLVYQPCTIVAGSRQRLPGRPQLVLHSFSYTTYSLPHRSIPVYGFNSFLRDPLWLKKETYPILLLITPDLEVSVD
jgi:hypothetical protein